MTEPAAESDYTPFFKDAVTGEPCVRVGNVLCHNADWRGHRHVALGLNIDGLRSLAESATPGPWVADVLGSEGYAVKGGSAPVHGRTRRMWIARCGMEAWETDRANAEYIAAIDPVTLLTLLDRLDRAEHAIRPGDHS